MWRPDLLDGFERRDLPLESEPLSGEPDEPLRGTLVRRTLDADPGRDGRRRAVLFLHGWNDYFFHTHVAEFYEAEDVTFYAVDLRRYGRSYVEGQFGGYVDHLEDYFEELDAAVDVIAATHSSVGVMAHSTGGLTASLWASAASRPVDALVLNSPWLDLWGPAALASVLAPLMRGLSLRNALSVIPLPDSGGGNYVASIHGQERGEWTFDLALKSAVPVPVRVGWLRAVLAGHARVAAGLGITAPVFMACSEASYVPTRTWDDRIAATDVVLDVEKIAARAPKLGDLVTLLRVPGGVHDLTLSARPAREILFAELRRWIRCYWPDVR